MSKLSPTQESVLKAAAKQPKADVREHLKDVKSPAARDKVVESLLKRGLIMEDPDADGVVYVISDEGFAAVGKKPKRPEKAEDGDAPDSEAAPEAENPPAEKPKAKREGSKKQIMIDMLSREEGATLKQLIEATGWQQHSVHGALANLRKKEGLKIDSAKQDGGERVYKAA